MLCVLAAATFSSFSGPAMAKQSVTVELFYSGNWQDHTAADDVYARNPVTIVRGRQDESGLVTPTTATFTLDNRDGDTNPRNPTSSLYGLVGRNTEVRITVGTSVRFRGRISSLAPNQSPDGKDAWVDVEAAGPLRQLGQGKSPLRDPLYRYVTLVGTSSVVGYWPLDDPDGSTQAASAVGSRPLVPQVDPSLSVPRVPPEWGKGVLRPWLPVGAQIRGTGNMNADVTHSGGWAVDLQVRMPEQLDEEHRPVFLNIDVQDEGDGTFGTTWQLQVQPDSPVTPGSWPTDIVVSASRVGMPLRVGGATGDAPVLLDGQPHTLRLQVLEASGDNVTWFVIVDGVTLASGTFDIQVATIPNLTRVGVSWTSSFTSTPALDLPWDIGQMILWGPPPSAATVHDAALGHPGEPAGERMDRLCDEENVSFVDSGDLDDTAPMGPQPSGLTLLEHLRQGEAADHGILYEKRDSFQLAYRTAVSLFNQSAALTLDYDQSQVAPPFRPVADDQATRNDITVTRQFGGTRRFVQAAGPLGVTAFGRVDHQQELSLFADGVLANHAQWLVHLGTHDGDRYPTIKADLDATPGIVTAVNSADVGDRIAVTNPPDKFTPDAVTAMVQGYTEVPATHRRTVTFNASPEESWHVPEVAHAEYQFIGSDSATMNGVADSVDTTISIKAGAGEDWVHEVDFDIVVAGERMTVEAIGAWSGTFPNRVATFTVVRSVNGVVKSHANGAAVAMFHKTYIGI